jgi:phosphate transport system permease protein
MATIELQTTAELAESRRKMQAKRRMKNRIALTLSMATMAFGLFWLIWILMSDRYPRYRWHESGAVYRNDAAAEYGGRWSGERPGGQRPADPVGDGFGTPLGIMAGFIWRNMAVNRCWRK